MNSEGQRKISANSLNVQSTINQVLRCRKTTSGHVHGSGNLGMLFVSLDPSRTLLVQLGALPPACSSSRGGEGGAAAAPFPSTLMFTLVFGHVPADLAAAPKGPAGWELSAE